MDIVSGIVSPGEHDVFDSFVASDLCPPVYCWINTGTPDANPSDLSTTTCNG